MLCSPLLHPDRTVLPTGLRNWLGARLSGPPRGPVRRQAAACIYAIGSIGDFVLALSALRLLLARFGAENCTLVLPPAVAALAAREFPSARRLVLPLEVSSLARGILAAWRRERPAFADTRYTQRICLRHQRTLYHEVTLSWIKAESDVRLLPATYPAAPADGLCTELRAHRQVAETVLGRPVSAEEILPRFTTLTTADDGRLMVYPLSREAARCLPVDLVIGTLQLWRQRCHAPIVLGGSPAEAPALAVYLAAAQAAKLDRVTVELPAGVDGFLQHIARAGAVLATESAAVHVATALDKPLLALPGGGYANLCYPWRRSDRQVVVQHPLPCFGCGWRCTQTERLCLTQLSPTLAAAALPAL
jgi:ADP-heptose:LPS heptosyltransferase